MNHIHNVCIGKIVHLRIIKLYNYFVQSLSSKHEHISHTTCIICPAVVDKLARRVASEEVTIQLFSSKSVPILLYGLEACVLNKHQIASLDFCH